MTDLYRLKAVWSGFQGSPGTTTLYSLAIHDPTKLGAFFTAVKGLMPNNTTVTVPNNGDVIESTTGALTGSWSGGTQQVVVCTGTGGYPATAGAMVRFTTSEIVNGRRLRGRLFLVPLISSQFDADGSPSDSFVTAAQTAATALVSGYAAQLCVWSRPFTPRPGDDAPALGGSHGIVTCALVPAKTVSLRTRRD